MKLIKAVLSGLVLFIFGLEVGGFGMWYMLVSLYKTPERLKTDHKKSAYEEWREERNSL